MDFNKIHLEEINMQIAIQVDIKKKFKNWFTSDWRLGNGFNSRSLLDVKILKGINI